MEQMKQAKGNTVKFISLIHLVLSVCDTAFCCKNVLLQNRFFVGTPHRQYKTPKFLHTKLLIFILLENTPPPSPRAFPPFSHT